MHERAFAINSNSCKLKVRDIDQFIQHMSCTLSLIVEYFPHVHGSVKSTLRFANVFMLITAYLRVCNLLYASLIFVGKVETIMSEVSFS
jgi:hypothetical protein